MKTILRTLMALAALGGGLMLAGAGPTPQAPAPHPADADARIRLMALMTGRVSAAELWVYRSGGR